MSANVTPQFGAADPNANPTTLVDLVTYLNTLFLNVAVQGGPFTPYVISSTTPAVSDQDKVWVKTDANGRPLEQRLFYNGSWRRVYNGNTDEYRIFGGDPSVHFDGTGLGIVGGQWDGWAVCNGQNGTPNLSNKFLINGAMDNSGITGYSGGHWNTNVSGGATQTGGSATYSIKNTDLPSMKVFVSGQHYSQGAATGIQRVLVDGDHNNVNATDLNAIASFGADPTANPPVPQTGVNTLPPYYSLAITKFVGYS